MQVKITIEIFADEDDPFQTDITPIAQGIIIRPLGVEAGTVPSIRMRNIADVILQQINTDSTEPQPARS